MLDSTVVRLSVLDVSPVPSGATGADALRNTLDLARLADALGYTRYWLAEHHGMPGVASSAPEVLIGHVAAVTSTLRVGSGGVMLPNHSPLKVAESFRMLEALHPGRIDLGIGRAPGTDPLTAAVLRRSQDFGGDDFPELLTELAAFLDGGFEAQHPLSRVLAMPDPDTAPPIWILGSSGYSARLAADRGLPFGFAHHINPEDALAALTLYHERFRPSAHADRPTALLATSVLCAETDEQLEALRVSADLAFLRLRQGRPGRVPSIEEAKAHPWTAAEREHVRRYPGHKVVGTPATARAALLELAAQARVDELMITTLTHEHAARRRSYELLARAFELPERTGQAATRSR